MLYFNKSLPLTEQLKDNMNHFHSKHIQKIIINKFDRLYDIKSLKDRCGLQSIFPLHDLADLSHISDCLKKQSYGEFIKEDNDNFKINYLVSLKDYFGSKFALLTAYF